MTGFADTVRAFRLEVEERSDQAARLIISEVYSRIKFRSPVDSGRFRQAWTISDRPIFETPEKVDAATAAGDFTQLSTRVIGKTWTISNPVPYGPKLEFGGYPNPPKGGSGKTIGGFSTQAPQGFVRLTVAEFPQIVAQATAEARA